MSYYIGCFGRKGNGIGDGVRAGAAGGNVLVTTTLEGVLVGAAGGSVLVTTTLDVVLVGAAGGRVLVTVTLDGVDTGLGPLDCENAQTTEVARTKIPNNKPFFIIPGTGREVGNVRPTRLFGVSTYKILSNIIRLSIFFDNLIECTINAYGYFAVPAASIMYN